MSSILDALPLLDGEVLVIDCQSTGATPRHGSLLEIGWSVARAAVDDAPSVTAKLVALPAGAKIPRPVSRITGITEAAMIEAVEVEVVWPALCEAADRVADSGSLEVTPTVIHYARFESGWLRDLHRRFEKDRRFPFDIVCTHEIARRLLPELPRRGLRALAGYFGFPVELLRRSAGHVAATCFVWHHLVQELACRGVHTWGALRSWLDDTAVTSQRGHVYPMSREKRLALPDEPGVYQLRRTGGDVLYVGKAISLKRRVNSYFTKRRGMGERMLEMLSQVRDVSVTVTATALEAALLESDEIKRRAPPYNVQLREEDRCVWFASGGLDDLDRAPTDRCRIGPMPSRWPLMSFSALRQLLTGEVPRQRAAIARAVGGASPTSGPDEECFLEGVALFARNHGIAQEGVTQSTLMALSKKLSDLQRAGQLDEGQSREPDDPRWDPARVARHVERVILQAGQLVRRARWLCLLCEATVAWPRPGAAARRVLVVSGGEVVERLTTAPDEELPAPPGSQRHLRQRQAAFDIATYDRMRTLSTELKRVTTETDDLEVRLSERVVLRAGALGRLLERV